MRGLVNMYVFVYGRERACAYVFLCARVYACVPYVEHVHMCTLMWYVHVCDHVTLNACMCGMSLSLCACDVIVGICRCVHVCLHE